MALMIQRRADRYSSSMRDLLESSLLLLVAVVAGCDKSSSGDGLGPASGSMDVLPTTAFSADGQPGGPFDESAIYTVRNSGDGTLFWGVSASSSWVAMSLPGGTLAPGASEVLTISVDAAFAQGLGAGQHAATITFTDLGLGGPAALVAATLEVQTTGPGGGALDASSTQFTAGGPKGGPIMPPSAPLVLTNPGPGSTSWAVTSDSTWLSLSQTSGTLAPGGQHQLSIMLQAAAANALDTGVHEGVLTFRDLSSALLVRVEVSLGVGTAIENQAWLNVHGHRFFPIGVWNQPPTQGQMVYLKGLGINTYLNNGYTPPEPTNAMLMNLLEANDMWAILQFDPAVQNHPRLLGWLLGDEPDLYNIPVATVQQDFDAIKAADPDHFIAMNTMGDFYWDGNFGNPSREALYQGYAAIPDIYSFDFYSIAGWHQPTWAYMPGAMVQFLFDRYLHPRKPVWAIIEACDLVQTDAFPGPTAAQTRFEVWDAIIHGATAIHYFTIAFDPFTWTNLTPAVEQELARTNGQIQELATIILSDPPAMTVTSTEASGQEHNFTLRRRGSSYFLFADNADMGYRSATISFAFQQPITSISVYGEGRIIAPNGASFTDAFSPLGVHIYEVRL